MHGFQEYVEAGGLTSYGPNFPDLFCRAAELVDKILRGVKPANLPVEQQTKICRGPVQAHLDLRDLLLSALCT